MAPHILPAFEALPVEVQVNILRQIASPEDVYSTIKASPKALSSFLWSREAILIEVLETHLPAEIFAEFLGLLHIPHYEDFSHVPNRSDYEDRTRYIDTDYGRFAWEACRYEAWASIAGSFLQAHFGHVQGAKWSGVQRHYSIPSPADKREINYIISMYGTLKRFIRDYQSFVRSILTGVPPPLSDLDPSFRREEALEPKHWPPLSPNETLRLQRGFLRYELCCRLNGIPAWDTRIRQWTTDASEGPFDSLSGYLQRWEEEEIRSIWTYVHRQYQVLVREVLTEFRCDIRRLSRKARNSPENEVVLLRNISFQSDIDYFGRWTYSMSCLGLPLLQQLLRSEFDDQRRFVRNTTCELVVDFEGALFLSMYNDLTMESFPQPMRINLPTTTGVNPIYERITYGLTTWCPTNVGRRRERLEKAGTRLKELGWVFWEDKVRLKNLRLLDVERLVNHTTQIVFEAEQSYPEEGMYVTKEDRDGELSAKYAVFATGEESRECFFFDRLRVISNWSSKEISPEFQELCSVEGPDE
ncbi:hypothetical protein N8I77_007088 [Diaporthe amygdali]|uniref:Uncharacterized protein n=1 Tax=Phomopsis amygdali TaxID=1214568 RepID=A0AAD9W116_PHOAM|nr:hypothetical protein N8I77_007088 [Diaporthe amygdali]